MNDDFDGWRNSATQNYAMVLFNDHKKLVILDKQLQVCCEPTETMKKEFDIARESWWDGEIDIVAIALDRANTLAEERRITPYRLSQIMGYYGSGSSQRARPNKPKETKQPNPKPKKENNTMITSVETKHYVNGNDVTKMPTEDKVAMIAATEKKIEDLRAVKTKSKMIEKEIAKLNAALAKAVELFDNE